MQIKDLTNILLVGLGGFLGSVGRYSVHMALQGFSKSFPWATLAVNIIGAFFIGVVHGATHGKISDETRLFLTVGFCGGFTTFSAFALENMKFLESESYILFFSYILSSLGLCVAATAAGAFLTR
ncbi:fluoride efflux transporter CrcB [Leptospira wolffii]|uniref:fluoride efflux transporter CrcB n=1 Tax=Leptospira wolffii TaxID=409998 RepID=UPI000318D1C8|nr:fluoride efflux transporter CrcB [Leptospira wolffii]EPG66160.1 protein CrcB [Leptospira wolffii serovar Khorat str. Khorat-H2]